MKYLLSFRNQSTGGAVVPGRLEMGPGLGTIEQLQTETRVTILLHGFNVNQQHGTDTLLRLAGMLPSAISGGIVAVLWPGDHWIGPLSYSVEGRDADDTASELARFLDDLTAPGAQLMFIGHSLGCRVVMETVARLIDAGRGVSQACVMAAAIDDYSLASPCAYRAATKHAGRVAALSSKRDKVLKFAYPAGDLLQSFLFWGDSGGLALGYHGPRPHGGTGTPIPANVVHRAIPKFFKVDHDDYLPDAPPSTEQQSAARFADDVIAGADDPVYR